MSRWPYEQWEAKTDLGIPIVQSPQSPTKVGIPHSKANTIDISAVCSGPNQNHETVQRRWSETSTDLLGDNPDQASGNSWKPWAFRFRKPSFVVKKNGVDDDSPGTGTISEVCPPELRERLEDVTASPGEVISLRCSLERGTRHSSVLWRRGPPDARVLRHAGRHSIHFNNEGVACLTISNCNSSDSGLYTCSISNHLGSVQTTCKVDVISHDEKPTSPGAVMDENCLWEQQQFMRRYEELEEIGRGRTCIVRAARDRGTGVRVALKQISVKQAAGGAAAIKREYRLLASSSHPSLPRGLAIFHNAPSPNIDTIVMELIRGPHLFTYISEKNDYSEATVAKYMKQLASALQWLHQNNISHLDIKPENIMVDISEDSTQLKLIDLGCAAASSSVSVVLPPATANLEFAAPESVLGRPRGPFTDSWSFGVLLYVFLSGVSPFLDDSIEETTTNIVKCDYCFPQQHFEGISEDVQKLIRKLLVSNPDSRITMKTVLQEPWLSNASDKRVRSTVPLQRFQQRRLPQTPPF